MKKTSFHFLPMLIFAILAVAGLIPLTAQSVITEEKKQITHDTAGGVTISKGSITEYAPGTQTIVVRSSTSPEPMRYSFTKQTTIVDQTGNPVAIESIQPGIPAEIHYTTSGNTTIASRIVVQTPKPATPIPAEPVVVPAEKRITTTTTTTRALTEEEIEAKEEAAERAKKAAEEAAEQE